MRFAIVLLCGALAVAADAQAEPITVSAAQINYLSPTDPSRTTFGPLTFRGGLVLTSGAQRFGGFSGLRVAEDGAHFRAVSDRASWLEGRIVYDGTKPVAIEDADLAPVLGARGNVLAGKRGGDTEALEVSGTTAWVGVEGTQQVLRFDMMKGLAAARGVPLGMPKAVSGLPGNGGVEALGLVPGGAEKGTLLLIAEEGFDAAGNHLAWLLPGRTVKRARTLSVKRRDEYAVTDITFLPGGDLVILERRYRPPFSLFIRMRRVAQADIAEGAVLDGEVLIEMSLPDQIDNMEGISAHKAADGTSVLTLISDDNFNGMQRNVLLQFGIAE
jgi:hypothetical protein